MFKYIVGLALLCIATASAQDLTCDECKDGISKLGARLLTEESMTEQAAILVATLCPSAPDAATCEAVISTHWALIAGAVYPVFFDGASLCATLGPCAADRIVREWTCENCVDGIYSIGMILTAEETVGTVIDLLKGDAFCGQEAAPDTCPAVVDMLVPAALPVLAGVLGETASQLCSEEIGVC